MISLLVTLITYAVLGLIVFQAFYVLGYRKFLKAGDDLGRLHKTGVQHWDAQQEESETYSPPVAIVLCLKGADESLVDCLTGLIGQDYPDFQLNIVIHCPTDPAAGVVEDFFAALKLQPKVHFLETPKETCSLKCAAIAQAIRSLSERIEVVALVDGDAVVDQDWLSDLVTPLKDESVGATTGNRWYSPTDVRLGAFVRKIWNAAAVVQMQRYDIAWGGSLAIRRDVIERCQLLSKWERSFCEDTSLTDELRKHKLRLHRVANLIVDNKETCSLWGTFHWISRQLLTVRLHHPAWPWVLLHGVATFVASILAPILMVVLFFNGFTSDAWVLLQTIGVYQLTNFALLYLIGRSNRSAIGSRDSHDPTETLPDKHLGMHFIATLVIQIIQPFALWQANSVEKVKWRGATYRVKDGRKIKLLKVGDQKKKPSRRQVAMSAVDPDRPTAPPQIEDNRLQSSRFSKPPGN